MNIHYHDLRHAQETPLKEKIDSADLFEEFKCRHYQRESDLIDFSLNLDKINYVPFHTPLQWKKAMATLIFAISGNVASVEDLKRARQLIEFLPKRIRKSLTPQQVFGTLPYLIIAFKMNLNRTNRDNTNSLENIVAFTNELFSCRKIKIRSFFCAHRDKREERSDFLIENVNEKYARRALYLANGIIKNATEKGGDVIWSYARGTPEGMNTVFPNIFLAYARSKRLDELSRVLEKNYGEMGELGRRHVAKGVGFSIEDATIPIHLADQAAISEKVYESQNETWRIILNLAQHDLKRLIPYASDPGFIKYETSLNNIYADPEINNAVALFKDRARRTFEEKIAREAMFYFIWGRIAREEGSLALGLDRDHNEYQTYAFTIGYSKKIGAPTPIGYARRTVDGVTIPGKELNRFSIRQFWR